MSRTARALAEWRAGVEGGFAYPLAVGAARVQYLALGTTIKKRRLSPPRARSLPPPKHIHTHTAACVARRCRWRRAEKVRSCWRGPVRSPVSLWACPRLLSASRSPPEAGPWLTASAHATVCGEEGHGPAYRKYLPPRTTTVAATKSQTRQPRPGPSHPPASPSQSSDLHHRHFFAFILLERRPRRREHRIVLAMHAQVPHHLAR